MERRDFLQGLACAAVGGMLPHQQTYAAQRLVNYDLPVYGNARLLHMTDCHAQLLPIYYREPNANLGFGNAFGRAPHLVGDALLRHYQLQDGGALSYALTHLDFARLAKRLGRMGGFAHLASLVDRLRAEYRPSDSLLLDGGDTWQGSGTAYWTRGKDMVDACNLLGVDVMTGHWEFTYREEEVRANIKRFAGDFIAQNVYVKEDALLEGAEAYDEDSGHAFPPYVMKELGGWPVAIIGQSFPYTPIANPSRFIPNWSFGIREQALQSLVDRIRQKERPALVVLLSHNGMDVDLKLAGRLRGLDVILGGHTHDAVPLPLKVANASGFTLVANAGAGGKFLGCLDVDLQAGRMAGYRYRLLPIFSDQLPAKPAMAKFIGDMRSPYVKTLAEPLAQAENLLFRRGNFNGSGDQLICDALRRQLDAEIALSPGFRWGNSVLPGEFLRMEDLLSLTAITYPETYVRDMSGSELKIILEEVADNLFNPDPYYQQGGDMVRVGGLHYKIDPTAARNNRISALQLRDGRLIEANKKYRVAGWATVASQASGKPVWEVVADDLRARKSVPIQRLDTPELTLTRPNPGWTASSG